MRTINFDGYDDLDILVLKRHKDSDSWTQVCDWEDIEFDVDFQEEYDEGDTIDTGAGEMQIVDDGYYLDFQGAETVDGDFELKILVDGCEKKGEKLLLKLYERAA